jgi:hypothetical protein
VIPEEDRGPAWLRDYGFTDFGDIAADITAMEEFAKRLQADVVDNYVPHMYSVSDAMLTPLPTAATTFPELVDFMNAHTAAQEATQSNVYHYANGTNHFATAAQTISAEYRGTDARSHAKVKDVDNAFDKAIAPDGGGMDTGGDA